MHILLVHCRGKAPKAYTVGAPYGKDTECTVLAYYQDVGALYAHKDGVKGTGSQSRVHGSRQWWTYA